MAENLLDMYNEAYEECIIPVLYGYKSAGYICAYEWHKESVEYTDILIKINKEVQTRGIEFIVHVENNVESVMVYNEHMVKNILIEYNIICAPRDFLTKSLCEVLYGAGLS